jgi:hypothetical protein
MSRTDLANLRAEALFVSDLQRSDQVTPDRVRTAVREAGRMSWCLGAVQRAYGAELPAA